MRIFIMLKNVSDGSSAYLIQGTKKNKSLVGEYDVVFLDGVRASKGKVALEIAESVASITGSYRFGTLTFNIEAKLEIIEKRPFCAHGGWKEYKVSGSSQELFSESKAAVYTSASALSERLYYDEFEAAYNQLYEARRSITNSAKKDQERLEEIDKKIESLESDSSLIAQAVEDASSLDEALTLNKKGYNELASQAQTLLNSSKSLLAESEKRAETFKNISSKAAEVNEQAEKIMSRSIAVSLASSFKSRKEEAAKSSRLWVAPFWISIAGMVVTAFYLNDSLSDLFRDNAGPVAYLNFFLIKLPFWAPLVWLAFFSSNRSSKQAALAEFYAQKQAIAEAYVGYKKEIGTLHSDDDIEQLKSLMEMNLNAITKDSGPLMGDYRVRYADGSYTPRGFKTPSLRRKKQKAPEEENADDADSP